MTGAHDREADYAPRYARAGRRGHVESHFFKATAPDGTRAIWLRHTLLLPRGGTPLAEVWAIAFERERGPVAAAKTTHPFEAARFEAHPFRYIIGDCVMEDRALRGRAATGPHALAWSLEHDERLEPYHPYPSERMYTAPFPRSKTLTPHPDVRAHGEVVVDGTRWSIDGWHAMRGHNWGVSNAERYAWAHTSSWDEGPDGAWLELVTGRVRVGPVLLPWLSVGALHVDGRTHRFDGARALASRAVDVGLYHYRTTLVAGRARLVVDARAEQRDLAGLHYANPDGSVVHCLNSKLARATVRLEREGEAPLELRTRSLALELGTTDTRHGVEMLL